jgi:hypothetical protein
VLAPVLVIDPALHVVHTAALETVEYLPAVHAVQAVAPELSAVLVTDPAPHKSQSAFPAALAKLPASHSMHADELDDPTSFT